MEDKSNIFRSIIKINMGIILYKYVQTLELILNIVIN